MVYTNRSTFKITLRIQYCIGTIAAVIEDIEKSIHQVNGIRNQMYEIHKKEDQNLEDQINIINWCDDGEQIFKKYKEKNKRVSSRIM